jgi:hypothetical protein
MSIQRTWQQFQEELGIVLIERSQPLGTILIGRWPESDCREVAGSGAASRVDAGGLLVGTLAAPGEAATPAAWRNTRRSSVISRAVV